MHLADDAVQEALLQAARVWPERGVPDNPSAWLLVSARRKAIDRVRAERADGDRASTVAQLHRHDRLPVHGGVGDLIDESALDEVTAKSLSGPDAESSQLRLMLLCSHPALDPDARVALTLRLVGGLTTAEIASAFLVPEATLAQRIVRAKRKIRAAGIPMTMPIAVERRLDDLLRVLYLISNEGYLSSSDGVEPVRSDLSAEAIRLTELLASLTPEEPEPAGLLALQLFSMARSRARLGAEGGLVLIEQQDRGEWDASMIARGNRLLRAALGQMRPGPYQVQALIASQHANAARATDTNWHLIADLYEQLEQMTASDIVKMNRAVAVAMATHAEAGLLILDSITTLGHHHRFHAVRGELLSRAGRPVAARAAFTSALGFGPPAAERNCWSGDWRGLATTGTRRPERHFRVPPTSSTLVGHDS